MKKIKIAYEWISPRGPLSNNRIPNLYDLTNGLEGTIITDNKRNNAPYLFHTFFRHYPDIFELSSVYQLKDDDLFVYDFQMHHRVSFPDFFNFGSDTGLIESSVFSDHAINLIRNKNGYILLDMAVESFVSNNFFFQMHNYFKMHNIPLHKIIYMTGCPNVEELYIDFCSQQNHGPERMKMLFWDSFEYQISQRIQNKEVYVTKRHIDIIEKSFLCLNYRYRQHRIDLTLLFLKNDLLKDSFYSIPAGNPHHPDQLFLHNVHRNFSQNIGLTEEDLLNFQTILPLKVDNLANSYDNHKIMTMDANQTLSHLYEKSLISVVTETTAYEPTIAETEKTFKPILYKQPFILVGQKGSLKNLRNKGYRTFSQWFDESYDDISDNHQRMMKIADICKQISNWDKNTKQNFIVGTKEVVEHNYQLLKNTYGKIIPKFWKKLQEG